MIPSPILARWHQHAPWSHPSLVEQDLILSECLLAIMGHTALSRSLAFRGGTALYKLFLQPASRYSEDLDFVRTGPGPIKPILESIQECLAFLPETPSIVIKRNQVRLRYRFRATVDGRPMRLKIEINTREHPSILPYRQIAFSVPSLWRGGTTMVRTYAREELLATKWRALFQRSKGRDLFDLWQACTRLKPDRALMWSVCHEVFAREGGQLPSGERWRENVTLKVRDREFRGDCYGLLRPGTAYDPQSAWATLERAWLLPAQDNFPA